MSNTKLILISVFGLVSLQGCAAIGLATMAGGAAGVTAREVSKGETHYEWKEGAGKTQAQMLADHKSCSREMAWMSQGRYSRRDDAIERCMRAEGHYIIEVPGADPTPRDRPLL